jgi:ATP synthase protein I
MVVELVTGMVLGLAIGFGLDVLFGTRPIFLVIFSLLGFGAGIRVMLGTARQMAKDAERSASDERD